MVYKGEELQQTEIVSDLDCLNNPSRAQYFRESGILELKNCHSCQMLAELATYRTGTRVGLVTVVVEDRQIFLGQFGLKQPWNSLGETPLTHSFCQHIVASESPLVINDAQQHKILKDNGAIEDLGVVSYLGVPLKCSNGVVVGSLCVIDPDPRTWFEQDLERLQELSIPVLDMFADQETQKQVTQGELLKLHQSQKLEAVGTLAGAIAHDFNNLLMIIQSSIELLKFKNRDEQLDEHIKEIQTTVDNAKTIVNRLVVWNRQQPENQEVVCISNSVAESRPLIDALMPANVSTLYDLASCDCPVLLCPAQLSQILLNLCANAESAMRKSGGKLSIAVNPLPDGKWVTLAVADTGEGIPSDLKNKIFDPFVTTKPNGSGIGLSMVNAIVQNTGGRIEVEDNIEKGTIITIYLPISDAVVDKNQPKKETVPMAQQDIRIMFVDDNVLLTETFCGYLQAMGYDVDSHTDGHSAFRQLQNQINDFDILICDNSMPELDGIQLIQKVRAIAPNLPVIMLTGYSHLVTADIAEKLGIQRILKKPISAGEVAEEVVNVCCKPCKSVQTTATTIANSP